MKRSLLLIPAMAFSLGAVATVSQAQNPAPGPGQGGPGANRGARRMQMLMQGITLGTEQQTRVDSIVAAYRAQMPAMTPGTPPDSATMARRRELMTQQDAAVRAVLTAEQQTVFDRNVEAARNMQGQRPGN